MGCYGGGKATTRSSCAPTTTFDSSTICCSSASLSCGSKVCAFQTLTQLDTPLPGPVQSQLGAIELNSKLSAYLAKHNNSSTSQMTQPTSVKASADGFTQPISVKPSASGITQSTFVKASAGGATSINPSAAGTTQSTSAKASAGGTIQPTSSHASTVGFIQPISIHSSTGGMTQSTFVNAPIIVTSSAASAIASPTAGVVITYYMDSDLNQYRAYDDGPLNGSIDFCSGPIPIATVNISHAGRLDLFSPFNTHGYVGCSYSRNNNEIGILTVPGSLMCSGWVNPVQCTPVSRIDAQPHICPG